MKVRVIDLEDANYKTVAILIIKHTTLSGAKKRAIDIAEMKGFAFHRANSCDHPPASIDRLTVDGEVRFTNCHCPLLHDDRKTA